MQFSPPCIAFSSSEAIANDDHKYLVENIRDGQRTSAMEIGPLAPLFFLQEKCSPPMESPRPNLIHASDVSRHARVFSLDQLPCESGFAEYCASSNAPVTVGKGGKGPIEWD